MLPWQLLLVVPCVSRSKDLHPREFSCTFPGAKDFLPSLAKCMMRLFLALILAGAIPNAWAGPGFQLVSPDELKMASEPEAPGAGQVSFPIMAA